MAALHFSVPEVKRWDSGEPETPPDTLFFQPPRARKAAVGQKEAVQGVAGLKWGHGTQAAPPAEAG